MGTGVLLDVGAYTGGAGADFVDGRCYAWASGDASPEELDGAAGRRTDGAPSVLCRARMLRDATGEAYVAGEYAAAKRRAASAAYADADRRLRGAGGPFAAWLRDDAGDDGR